MPTPHPDTAAASEARKAARRAQAREALDRRARRVSWKALEELERRVATPERAGEIATQELVQVAKLGGGLSRETKVTVGGDPTRPLIIGLAPARDLPGMGTDVPELGSPVTPPELTDGKGRLLPQRLSLALSAPKTDPDP